MPTSSTHSPSREFVSLSELAQDILGMSRARLYELIARGAMPSPVFCVRTRRPMFTKALIQQARMVRQTGVGIDGSALIFYRREATTAISSPSTPARARRGAQASQANRHAEVVLALQGLGVTTADERTVGEAIAQCFPNGLDGQQESDVIRVIFRHLRRRESA